MFVTEMIVEQMNNKSVGENQNIKVIIYQSMNNEQIMLPELGFVNALQAYFELHKIDYLIDQRSNAEYMSPDGQLPLIKYGHKLVSGYWPIVEFINNANRIESKGDQTDGMARINLFEKVVIEAELYYTWFDKDIYEQYTKSNYSYGKPWPLNNVLCWLKRRDIASRIRTHDNVRNIHNELEGMFEVLNQDIMNPDELISQEILCLIYGHLKAILSFGKPYEALYSMVKKYPVLIEFVQKFETKIH